MYLKVLEYAKHQSLIQLSWNYMNDALRSDVFVRYDPETVACACIYLSARRLKISLPKAPAWFTLFHVTQAQIDDVCKRILRLYLRPKVSRTSEYIVQCLNLNHPCDPLLPITDMK
jgi:hypothetical protein